MNHDDYTFIMTEYKNLCELPVIKSHKSHYRAKINVEKQLYSYALAFKFKMGKADRNSFYIMIVLRVNVPRS